MDLILHIVHYENDEVITHNLTNKQANNIEIKEYDFIYFELVSEVEYELEPINLVLGNTIINFNEDFDSLTSNNSKYIYSLKKDEINSILPSNSYYSKKRYKTISGQHKFSRLFINELGNCQPHIIVKQDIFEFNSIYIKSPKIDDSNFKFIIEYLMFNNYFDEKIIYKNTLDSLNNNVNNSFLESLKKLLKFSELLLENIYLFKIDSIRSLDELSLVKDYTYDTKIDSNSISWLLDNLNELTPQNNFSSLNTIKIKNKLYDLKKINQPESFNSFSSYENKVINGFLELIINIVKNKQSKFKNKQVLRTRISSFKDYLENSLNDLIIIYLNKISGNFFRMADFFKTNLNITDKIYQFPSKTNGFLSKKHYKDFLDLMIFTKNIFSLETKNNYNYKLEIESFDKLYEVYCFYLIKDSLASLFDNRYEERNFKSTDHHNKLCGKYTFSRSNFEINLFYESLPEDFFQLTKTKKGYSLKPDFVVEVKNNEESYYLILDAKYKKYNNSKLNMDMENLSYKYLHKIGIPTYFKNKVLGLYTISINTKNNFRSIYLKDFDLFGVSPIFPQLGSIEINPVQFDFKENSFHKILKKFNQITFSKPSQLDK